MADFSKPGTAGASRQRVRMSDLAARAGVSKSTVSRALAGSELVNAQTRERIAQLAQQMGYRMDRRARNFRLRENLTIAVAIPAGFRSDWRISDPFFLELVGGISDALADAGHQLLLSRSVAQPIEWIEDFVAEGTVDGLILIGQGVDYAKLNDLAEQYEPLVVWGAALGDESRYVTVGSDNERGGYLATSHLLEQGREHVIFLGDTTLPEARLRFEGYTRALRESDKRVDPQLVVRPANDREGAYRAIQAKLREGPPFDAIFAFSDVFALAAMRALAEAGVDVPQHVSVVGYDDLDISAYYNPSLSSIHQDRHEGGRLLVERLLAQWHGEPAESATLPTRLIVRESSWVPRSA